MNKELWGITDSGFYRPTFEEIVKEKEKEAKKLFGNDFDTREITPQGKYIRINAADDFKIYEEMEQLYYSNYPGTATGISLDRICKRAAITRNPATYAIHKLNVYGTENHEIPAITLFSNESNLTFWSTSNVIINQPETTQGGDTIYYAEVTVQCTEPGIIGNVYNINRLVEVDPDVTSVLHVSIETEGEATESDHDLRERYENVLQGLGTNTTDAIKAKVLKVPTVKDVDLINNTSDTGIKISDNLTILPNTYGIIVYANGEPTDEIATAIYQKQPLGISQSGNITTTVRDDSGEDHIVKFTYVQEKEINITIECVVDENFEIAGKDKITANLEELINNNPIGEDVIYSTLYGCIWTVPGVKNITDLSLNGGTTDISINRDEISQLKSVSITVLEA